MAWNPSPEVAAARDFAKKFGFKAAFKNVKVSEFGESVADLLDDWQGGIYHLDEKQLKKVPWGNDRFMPIAYDHCLSTFDFNSLTTLVFLAHDYGIRVEVNAVNPRYVGIMFHKRERYGGMSERHPTLEEAVAAWRENHRAIEEKAPCPT